LYATGEQLSLIAPPRLVAGKQLRDRPGKGMNLDHDRGQTGLAS